MKLADFDALTFDCYGTLIDWQAGILAALAPWRRRLLRPVEDGALLAAFARHEARHQALRPTALYPVLLAATFRDMAAEFACEASASEAETFARSVKDWPAFPDSPAALTYLKRHYKLVIVSNIDRASFRHSNEKLGVEFDHIVTAEDVRSYKPALAHFHAAFDWLQRHGVAQEKVLHTAQSLFHDHVPAKALGLKTIWINRYAGQRPRTPAPDWEVPSLAAMVELHGAHAS